VKLRAGRIDLNQAHRLSGIDSYFQSIQALQARVIENQRPQLDRAAIQMVATIRRGGRIFVFGTGHSHLMAEEAFYRAGGLAPVTPIFSSLLMLHEDPTLSGLLERTPGLAGPLLDRYQPQPGEMIFIFSNSGVNQMPVEMALEAARRGLFTVSVSSLAYAQVAPLSALGKRLDEVAEIAIDNGGEPGDALAAVEGMDWRAGPSSTIIGALIWNSLVVETASRLRAAGEEPPLFASFNVPGAAEHNAALLEKWRRANRHL
jgi:uncharacterized phosphosugar-binding protein